MMTLVCDVKADLELNVRQVSWRMLYLPQILFGTCGALLLPSKQTAAVGTRWEEADFR